MDFVIRVHVPDEMNVKHASKQLNMMFGSIAERMANPQSLEDLQRPTRAFGIGTKDGCHIHVAPASEGDSSGLTSGI